MQQRSAGESRAYSGESVLRDLQALLGHAVQRLCERSGCEVALAWALREDGTPYVAAARYTGTPPRGPAPEAFRTAAGLPHATDLTEPGQDLELRELARLYGCDALAPVRAGAGAPLAALLLRLPPAEAVARPALGGRVPPRVLAELEACAQLLSGPLSAALAHGRLQTLESEVRQLDRRAALGALATEVAHELRNPLVSLKTLAQLLPERREDAEFVGEFCDVVGEELARMGRLLDQLIDYGRPGEARETPAPVEPALAATAALLRHVARRRNVALEVECEPELPRVALGADRLRQVLLNLAQNAVEATPSGGSVRLRARGAGPGVELSVEDDGPGIPEELRELVFEPFVSTRRDRPGGLGLTIARRLVEEAGGALSLGAPPLGTEFRISLPRAG